MIFYVLFSTNIYVAVDTHLKWSSFVAPLNERVWILIVVSIFFSWGVGYFIRNLHGFHINEDHFPLFNSFRAFCYQGKFVLKVLIRGPKPVLFRGAGARIL